MYLKNKETFLQLEIIRKSSNFIRRNQVYKFLACLSFPLSGIFSKLVSFSLNLSDHFYNEQACCGIEVLLTPVQDLSDALKHYISYPATFLIESC